MRPAATIFSFLVTASLLIPVTVTALSDDLKEEALEAFRKADYPRSIELLKLAQKENPDDPEIYYYLGYFTHYLCYDSIPLRGFSRGISDQVLAYLERAVELDPSLGNAYYFIGIEYGARATNALMRQDIGDIRHQLLKGRERGGYPDWLLEYARNMLRGVASNGIVFVGGDAEAVPLFYLQVIEKLRPDITVIPMALMDRPWYVMTLKKGLEGVILPVPLELTDGQVMSLRPSKWQSNVVRIPIPDSTRTRYHISDTHLLWELEPDLRRGNRTLLSSSGAVLENILQSNEWQRPVYFSASTGGAYFGLRRFLQLIGLCYELKPFDVEAMESPIDVSLIEQVLLDRGNYGDLPSVKTLDMPRASHILNNYRAVLLRLARHYRQNDEPDKTKAVVEILRVALSEDVLPIPEQYRARIEKLYSEH